MQHSKSFINSLGLNLLANIKSSLQSRAFGQQMFTVRVQNGFYDPKYMMLCIILFLKLQYKKKKFN